MSLDVLTRPAAQVAWVVFTDETRVWWLRLLKRGFRHCLVIVEVEDGWVSIDPLLRRIAVMFHPSPAVVNLPDYLRSSGYFIVKTEINFDQESFALPGVMHCVGVVKRVIGVRCPWVTTPWQLYKFLRKSEQIHQGRGD